MLLPGTDDAFSGNEKLSSDRWTAARCVLCVVRCSLGPTTAARGIKNMGCKKCSILIGAAAHHAPLLLFCCCALLCQHSKHIASYMGMCAVQ